MAESDSLDPPVRFDPEGNLGARGGVAAWLEYAVTRIALGGTSRLPRGVQRALTGGLARLATRFDRRHTEAARRFLSQALGESTPDAELDRRIVLAYRHLFQISLDAEAFESEVLGARLLEHYEVEEAPGVREAIDAGRGGIVISPHVGDWEAGSATMPHFGMTPAYAVARPPKNRYLSAHLLRIRERRGLTVMPRRGGMAQAARILESGGWIAMLLDQRPSGKHVLAPFFGRLAPCERSAAVLIRRMRVPVVFCACYLTERPFRYDLCFPRVVPPEELASLSVGEVTALINAEMEQLILRRPEQYFWLHDRYRDAPPIPEGGHEAVAEKPDRTRSG